MFNVPVFRVTEGRTLLMIATVSLFSGCIASPSNSPADEDGDTFVAGDSEGDAAGDSGGDSAGDGDIQGSPEEFAALSQFAGVRGLGADADYVYWASRESIWRKAKLGGDVQTLMTPDGDTDFSGIHLGDGRIYVADAHDADAEILSVALDGTDPRTEFFMGPGASASDVHVFGGYVWWGRMSGGAALWRVRESMPEGESIMVGAHQTLTSNSDFLFSATTSGALFRITPTDASVTTLLEAGSGQQITDLVATDTHVYFLMDRTEGPQTLESFELASGEVTVLVDDLSEPRRLARDGEVLCWTGGLVDVGVVQCLEDGTISTIADGLEWPLEIVMDTTHIYWGDNFASKVFRVER